MIACGLDFGTSNSAIGVARNGKAELAPVEHDNTLMPSAVFFDYETKGRVLFGNEAIGAYIGQTDGRLMRALKSILGSPLIDEETSLGNRKVPFTKVVEIFVRHLKAKAEAFAGQEITRLVHGRPVRFDDDDAADKRAQKVLEGIAKQAGFREIAFVYEPVAAVHHYEATVQREELVLIADIGGGTSDFSIVRVGPQHRERADRSRDVLASTGVRVGGTDFDSALNLATVMPLLGLGTQLKVKNLPMPKALYNELATWATINFAYTHRNEREVEKLIEQSCEPEKVERLLEVLHLRLGHRIAFVVEDAKIALSAAPSTTVPLDIIQRGLAIDATRRDFDHATDSQITRLSQSARDCIKTAGLKPNAIETVFLTGGSSRVPAVRTAICKTAPSARLAGGEDLLSVALGLTRMAGMMS